MNYLGEFSQNDRYATFSAITTFRRSMFKDKFDDEEIEALRKLQLKQMGIDSTNVEKDGAYRVNNNPTVISILPVQEDQMVNEHQYMIEREAVEEEQRNNAGELSIPLSIRIDPRDKLKLNETINALIMSQKVFLTRSGKDIYEHLLQFIKDFNTFSSMFQSYQEQIERDRAFKIEFEIKLIKLEELVNKVITFIRLVLKDPVPRKEIISSVRAERLIDEGLDRDEARLRAQDYADEKIIEEKADLPNVDKNLFKVQSQQGQLSATYTKEYILQMYRDVLRILKEMIKGKPIHAFMSETPDAVYRQNVEFGQVQPLPNFNGEEQYLEEATKAEKNAQDREEIAEAAMEEEKEKMRKAEEEILKERRDENDKQELAYVEFMNRVSSLYNKGLGYLVKGNGIIKTGSDNADELPNLVQQCRDINKVFEEMRVQYPLYSATIDRHLLPENSITRLSFFSVFLRYGTIIEEDPTTKMNEMIRSIQVLKRGRRSTGHAIIQAVNYATDVLQAVSDLMAGFPDFANRSWVDTQSDDVKDLISRFMEAEDTANEVMSLATDFREDEDANERANERVRLELSDRRKRISDAFNSAHAKGSTLYNDKKHMKDIYDASVDFNTDILTKYASNGVDDLLFSPKDIANAHIRYVIAGTVLTSDTIQIMRIGEAKVDRLKREGKIDEATTVAQKVVQYAKSVIGTLETVSSDLPEVREGGEFHPWYNERYTFAQTVIERFDPDGTLGIPKEEDGKPKVEDSKPKEDSRPKRDQLPYNRWRIDFIQPVINEFRKLISGRLASRSKQVPSRESIGKLLVLATNIIVRSKKLELIQLSKAASDLPKIDVEGKTYLHFIEAVVKAQTVADLTDEEVIDAMKLREFFEKVKASLGLSGEESRLIDRFVEKLYE